MCFPCQAASSNNTGMETLQRLKEILADEGCGRVEEELEGFSRDILRRVSTAANVPVNVSGRSRTMSELRSALLAVLNPSEEQKEAGCVQM